MSLPFYIVNAFTIRPYGGNPAAIVFVKDLSDGELLQNIANNFNQPMTAFLRAVPVEGDESTTRAVFEVRWFTSGSEQPLCGHATIASSGLMFTTPGLIAPSVEVIEYKAKSGLVLTARKTEDGWIDLTLPAAQIQTLPDEETARLAGVVGRALGKEVHVNYAGVGKDGFSHFLIVEIEEKDDLAGCKPSPSILLETGYQNNVVTSASPDPSAAFISRMFAPASGNPEDPVCGAAHCLLTPYWAQKLAKAESAEMPAKQVSARGGDIRVQWHAGREQITLSGQSRLVMQGEVLL